MHVRKPEDGGALGVQVRCGSPHVIAGDVDPVHATTAVPKPGGPASTGAVFEGVQPSSVTTTGPATIDATHGNPPQVPRLPGPGSARGACRRPNWQEDRTGAAKGAPASQGSALAKMDAGGAQEPFERSHAPSVQPASGCSPGSAGSLYKPAPARCSGTRARCPRGRSGAGRGRPSHRRKAGPERLIAYTQVAPSMPVPTSAAAVEVAHRLEPTPGSSVPGVVVGFPVTGSRYSTTPDRGRCSIRATTQGASASLPEEHAAASGS